MEYITIKEACEKWGLGNRIVSLYCSEGRISGVTRKGNLWLIPTNAKRPADNRRSGNALSEPIPTLSDDLIHVFAAAATPMPVHKPDAILDNIEQGGIRLIYEAELAYLRGDFKRVMNCYDKTLGDDAVRLRICPIAIAAAISMGDYHTYTQIDAYLKGYLKADTDRKIRATAELALATAAVSVIAPNMAPDWLKTGDLNAILPQARPNAIYLRVKYFSCIGKADVMLALAQTALSLSSPESGITMTDIYLRLTCAVSCYALEQKDEAKKWLLSAMRLALPHGLVTPFSENVTALGGIIEQCLEEEFPDAYKLVMEQWERTWKNWITFHNQFTKDNITLILSLREYHLAVLVARRVPYFKIAKQYGISVGRLKNIMLEIREKLFLSNREELEKFIL